MAVTGAEEDVLEQPFSLRQGPSGIGNVRRLDCITYHFDDKTRSSGLKRHGSPKRKFVSAPLCMVMSGNWVLPGLDVRTSFVAIFCQKMGRLGDFSLAS